MARHVRFVGFFSAVSLVAGCVFDATGERQTGASTGTGGEMTSSSTGFETTTVSSGSVGPGGGPVCGDGIVQAPEQCETGDVSFASCAGCMIANQCGNQTIDPGESCDVTSADCSGCQVTGGVCFGVEALPFTLQPTAASSATSLTIPGSFADTQTCGSATTRPVKVYRYDVGPYPSGLYVSATGDGGSANQVANAVIWAYHGCTTASFQCNDVDPDPLVSPNNTAFVAVPLQAPGSVIFVAIGDSGSAAGSFHFIATPIRLFADFESTNDGFTLAGGWAGSSHFVSVSNPTTEATLESGDIDVVGIDNMSIALAHSLSGGANATVTVVPDGAAALPSVPIPDTAGKLGGTAVKVSLPKGTKSAKLRLVLTAGNNPYWELHRLIVGPA